jgi:multidrug resistance efflux pump
MYVKAEKAELVETESNMTYRGRVTAFDNVSLAAEVQGKIMRGDVRFKAGESFNKGDTLIKIYSRDVEATLKSGKSSLLQTISTILPDIKVDFPLEYEKWNSFFNDIDTENPLPHLPPINSNKEKVFLSANNVLSSYYDLQQQEINLLRYTIKAPFDGSFTSVSKEIGAIASPGSELATIIRSDKLEITVPVFPIDLDWF